MSNTYKYIQDTGFNLSEGCFGPTLSKIAPNGQIWDFSGSYYDGSAPNYVARLFYLKKIKKNDNMVQKKIKNVDFREKKSLRSYMPSTKVGKIKSSNKSRSKLINLIIHNHF